jgi:hypothetical protein
MRPTRRQAHVRFDASGENAQLARSFQLEIDLERERLGAVGGHAGRRGTDARREEPDALAAGLEPLRLAVPVDVDGSGDAARIADAEADRRAVPHDVVGRRFRVGESRRLERAPDLQARGVDHYREERSLSFLRIDGAIDVQRVRQESIMRHGVLLPARVVGPRIPVRDGQHGSTHGLGAAPVRADVAHDLVAPRRAFADDAAHHRQGRVQRHQNHSHDQQPDNRRCPHPSPPELHSVERGRRSCAWPREGKTRADCGDTKAAVRAAGSVTFTRR